MLALKRLNERILHADSKGISRVGMDQGRPVQRHSATIPVVERLAPVGRRAEPGCFGAQVQMSPALVEREDAQIAECGDTAETSADTNRFNRGTIGARKAVPAPAHADEVPQSDGGCQHPLGRTRRAELSGVRNARTGFLEVEVPGHARTLDEPASWAPASGAIRGDVGTARHAEGAAVAPQATWATVRRRRPSRRSW
jgi:hypothetical protein